VGVTPVSLADYYKGIEDLSDRLGLSGAQQQSESLVNALRSGSTFGECLSNTGVALRVLADDPAIIDAGFGDEVLRLKGQCSALWDESNGRP
jgi:hypothetical protein